MDDEKVYIELDKKREFCLDLNTLSEIEDAYGDFDTAVSAFQKKSAKALRFLLYAGLKHEDDSLTLEQVGAMVKIFNLSKITDKIAEVLKSQK